MTTLIAFYTSDGCVGRCDARCYEATTLECHCICGGANHGASLDKAIGSTTKIFCDAQADRYSQEHLEAPLVAYDAILKWPGV